MDPEDERILKLQEGLVYFPEDDSHIGLRLYEIYELRERRAMLTGILREPAATIKAKILASMGIQKSPRDNCFLSSLIRFRRFCDTIRGFHSGSLDLTGRHRERYESHLRRFVLFVAEFCLAMRRADRDVDRKSFCRSPLPYLPKLCRRWRLSPYISVGNCAIQLSEALYAMANTAPKIQQLNLIDLPPEILCHISSFAHMDEARRFGMACRTLRAASSPFAFKSRTLALRFDPLIRRESSSLQPNRVLRFLQDAKNNLITEQIDFTLSHPQILRHMKVLYLRNDWPIEFMARANVTTRAPESYMDFWAPIVQKFEEFLRHVNLAHLELFEVGLDIRMLDCLSKMPNLRNVKLMDCPFLVIPPPETSLRIASVANADFRSDHMDLVCYMELLPLLSHLRCLVINAYHRNTFHIPIDRPDFIQRCNPFGTLERLYIEYMRNKDVPGLCTWIRIGGASAGGLHLTHFKLATVSNLQEPELMGLIDALAPAPLRVLALDGIAYAKLPLFDRLADAFPDLQALTLVYHGDPLLHYYGNMCTWPHATWEYAPRFAGFRALKHFSWNLNLSPVSAPSPWDMPLMEAGYPESEVRRAEDWGLELEEHTFSEWDCIPRMFLAHCGTLESLVFSRGPASVLEWDIKHGEDGVVEITPHAGISSNSYLAYNPELPIGSWFFNDLE